MANLDDVLDKSHVITYVYFLYALGGLIVVIVHPETLSFNDYTNKLVAFGAAVGLSRGYVAGKKHEAEGRRLAAAQRGEERTR